VRTLAGNYQLFALVPALLAPFRNPFWFELVSKKVMRLLTPWLLLVLGVASAGALAIGHGQPRVMALLVAGQLALYVAAAVGGRAGRLAGVARTFVVLGLAPLIALARYLDGRQRVTW